MTAVEIRGLAAWLVRLRGDGAAGAVKLALHDEAEALSQEARMEAPALADSVEVRDVSRDARPAFAVGTPDPAGRYAEYGTARRLASPWLLPVFRARTRGIKHKLGKVAAGALKRRPGGV